MNRLGFRFDNLRRTLPELLASPNLELDAVYTHFATADDPESPLFDEQRVRFERALRDRGRSSAASSRTRGIRRPRRIVHAREQRRAPARLARLVRPRAARAAALRHRPAAARVDAAADAGHDARQPRRRGEGRARRTKASATA